MGFSVKLAPGVRVRVSSHGVRAGIGPRIARVHVGTGRTGLSSGLGPFSVYGAVGGKSRRKSTGTGYRPMTLADLAGYLTALGDRLLRRDIVADVFIVGGAAMALAYDATRVTPFAGALTGSVARVLQVSRGAGLAEKLAGEYPWWRA
jgi:hypothetical protein